MSASVALGQGVLRRRNPLAGVMTILRVMARNRTGFVGFLIVILIVVVSIVAPIAIPFNGSGSADMIYATPSWAHPLGTDHEGKDVWVQVLRGGLDVVLVGFLSALISTVVAVVLGALSAFIGGWVDTVITGITDVVLTIPQLPLFIVLSGIFALNSTWQLSLILGGLSWPFLLRAVRAQVLSLKEREYVEAARMLDLGTVHVLFREVLPNMMSYIVINFVIAMTNAIYGQITLYFLGLVPLAGDNWGLMINLAYTKGALFFKNSLWYVLAPILCISLLQLAMVMITRALEDLFNPRLREG